MGWVFEVVVFEDVFVFDFESAGFFVDFDVLVVDFAGVLEFFAAVVVLPVFDVEFFEAAVFDFGSFFDLAVVFAAVFDFGVGFGVAFDFA